MWVPMINLLPLIPMMRPHHPPVEEDSEDSNTMKPKLPEEEEFDEEISLWMGRRNRKRNLVKRRP